MVPNSRAVAPLMVTGRVHFTAFYEWLRDQEGIDDPLILEERHQLCL